MSGRDLIEPLAEIEAALAGPGASFASGGVEIRELVALADEGRTPMLVDPGCTGGVAVRALSVVDLHEAHIGRRVVVAFERGDAQRPIVMGVIAGEVAWPAAGRPSAVDVSVDNERVVVSAKAQLVLRCGKASITLTSAGKVLVEGSYILSRSSGVNRVKGGSVQLN